MTKQELLDRITQDMESYPHLWEPDMKGRYEWEVPWWVRKGNVDLRAKFNSVDDEIIYLRSPEGNEFTLHTMGWKTGEGKNLRKAFLNIRKAREEQAEQAKVDKAAKELAKLRKPKG